MLFKIEEGSSMASLVAQRRSFLTRAKVEQVAEEWNHGSEYDKENLAIQYFPQLIATCTQLFSDIEEAAGLIESEGNNLSAYGKLYRRTQE